ncbi:MAG: hypothetical protein AB1393_03925 [Candidatus Edwardsbacteria bacterium]
MGQKCVNCGKPAIMNIQKLWIKWKYNAEKDEYSSKYELIDIEPNESENLHLCNECVKLWEHGDI